jgi:hypothetical protein
MRRYRSSTRCAPPNDLDRAVARLGDVESEVVEEAARIEALERRVEGMMDRTEGR